MEPAHPKPVVLIIVENLPVPLDRRVWQEARALQMAGYRPVVICPKMHGHTAEEEVLEGIRIYRHWISQEGRGTGGFLKEYASALWGEFRLACKLWRRHRFKIIHLCNPPDLLFLVAAPFKMMGVRIIYDVHDLWPEMFEAKFGRRGLFYWGVRLAERLTYSAANVVLATNETVRATAQRRGRKRADCVFVVRTAPQIDGSKYAPDPALKKGRRFLVGYVGIMGSADGVGLLMEAAAELVYKQGRQDIQFLLMGMGPEFPMLEDARTRLGLREYVDLPGRVVNDALFRALATIDLGVSCDPKNSYNDACTMNKVLEYMVFGKAQVSFDLTETRASAGDAGCYVQGHSAADLARAIEELLDDPAKRQEMGQRGLKRFEEELTWDKSVVQLLAAYDRAQQG